MPVLPHFDQNPPYAKDSNLRLLVGFMRSAHLVAYPAPPSALAEKAYQTYVIPNMFAKAVQGASDGDAIASATTALVDSGSTTSGRRRRATPPPGLTLRRNRTAHA